MKGILAFLFLPELQLQKGPSDCTEMVKKMQTIMIHGFTVLLLYKQT